jgi:SAM-dependent methyltransferase
MVYNSVLKNKFEVIDAEQGLSNLKLFRHHWPYKSWDTYKMIKIISDADRQCYVLDVGCYESPILPMLKRLGFINLYGCDLVLQPDLNSNFVSAAHRAEYKPIAEMYGDKSYRLAIQNLEKTTYSDQMFDHITSLSVIEHGVNIEKYFIEMSRILKRDGYLLTSTDYWPEKIFNGKNVLSKGPPDNIFSRAEIESAICVAEKKGLRLIEPIDFEYEDKVVHWNETGLDYTFIFFAMRKV